MHLKEGFMLFFNFFKKHKEQKAKQAFQEKIKEQKRVDAMWNSHYTEIRSRCLDHCLGRIEEIKYLDVDDLSKNRYAAEIRDMLFWVRFKFYDGREEIVQYHKAPDPKQRRLLEYSGTPSLLDCCSIGAPVMGYFSPSGELIALNNLSPFPKQPA